MSMESHYTDPCAKSSHTACTWKSILYKVDDMLKIVRIMKIPRHIEKPLDMGCMVLKGYGPNKCNVKRI